MSRVWSDPDERFWRGPDNESGDRIIHPISALILAILAILVLFWIVIEYEGESSAEAASQKLVTNQAPQVSTQMMRLGSSGETVKQVQSKLSSFGYTLAVDGQYGPVTTKVVTHWQRANGLIVDGITGPQTLASLGIAAGGVATQPAVRGEQTQVAPEPAAPASAPASSTWTRCPQWESTAKFFGLPDRFDYIIHRESRCNPGVTSRTGCCHGLAQIHRIHLPKPECDAYTESDLFDPAKNLCVASVIYKQSGMSPWAL